MRFTKISKKNVTPLCTGKSIDLERHRTVPEKRMLLRVELDPSGYYPAGWNPFKRANLKLF